MVSLTAFWLIDSSGVLIIANIMLSFFSGFLLPIDFFPPWLSAVARALPFQAITQLPAEALLGRLNGMALMEALLIQAFWALALTALALLLLRVAVSKVVVQGG
jgi:ABC-2 type transport system permease protein